MEIDNQTNVMYFILLGLSDNPKAGTALFALFLAIYSVGVVSNIAIMVTVTADPQLHTPMYFFFGNLSLVDICLTTVTVPQLLINIISDRKVISFQRCITQLYFFVAMVGTDCLLLGVMAYDRYVAICSPLRYFMVMDKKACSQLVARSWAIGLLNSLLHSLMITRVSFCASNLVQNLLWDIPPLQKLSCSDTSLNELLILAEAFPIIMASILSKVISYGFIITTILSINLSEGRRKAFHTCSSHLIVVSLFYGTILFTYIRPPSSYSLEKDKVVTVMYAIITPMLNPFIYSLTNEKIKGALSKMVDRCSIHLKL
ncbi:hypothetical protein NDU88_000893 [Pleurodeles waltl]|uniref:Olfactory receptor n=1 Tax=Pleurodeles waltl TaxID=8319 RepID=A0AAV7LX55_PLEWA|nr:hypothetical protein NDU88_000893 [Pleurodeles waltl]